MIFTDCLLELRRPVLKVFRRSSRKSPAPKETTEVTKQHIVVSSKASRAPPPNLTPQEEFPKLDKNRPQRPDPLRIVIHPSTDLVTVANGGSDARTPSPGTLTPIRRGSGASSQRSRADSRDSAADHHALKKQLERARKRCHKGQHFIIPRCRLEELVTIEAVAKDIQTINPEISEQEALKWAEQACECASKLYATLAYVKRGADIGGLLEEGIDDADLPLVRRRGGEREYELQRRNGQTIATFTNWSEKHFENFDRFQFWINAPVFEEMEHYEFDDETILPFLELKLEEDIKPVEGGYSKVYPVRIHPAHHKFWKTPESEEDEPLVAVKQLFSSAEQEFQKEKTILQDLGSRNHPNLIKLLATFKQEDKYHLIFPFADANLRTYWKDRPKPAFDAPTILWSLGQMKGIADALQVIHNFTVTFPLPTPSASNVNVPKDVKLSVRKGEELFGRHGDIKPENVLWFKKDLHLGDPNGVLQIADFGLGRFHGRDSRSRVDPESIAASPTYEPPECKLRLPVSRAYDVWSLGCLYLEFITWLLKGSDEIEGFSNFRGRVAPSTGIDEDNFYTVLPDSFGTQAIVREEVCEWVEKLHSDEKCSQLIHELLDLTMKELLIVESKNRISSRLLFHQLRMYLNKAETNSEYILKPVPRQAKQGRSNSTPEVRRAPKANLRRTSVTFADENGGPSMPNTNSKTNSNTSFGKPKDLVFRNRGTPSHHKYVSEYKPPAPKHYGTWRST